MNIYTVEPLKTAASVLENKRSSIQIWAAAMLAQKLHEEPTFIAYCELPSYGPKNDWNGKRSLAIELMRKIEMEIAIPAGVLYRSLI
jgi:hypothetical protein